MMESMDASLIAPMASSLIQPVASSLLNVINGKGSGSGFLPLLTLLLMMRVLREGVRGAGKRYNNMDYIHKTLIKLFSSAPSFKQYQDY